MNKWNFADDCRVNVWRWPLVAILAAGLLLLSSCVKRDANGVPLSSTGLKPGINYMQPNKWEFSYRYRVKQVKPKHPIRDSKPSVFDAHMKVTGKGTYEVWMFGPIAGDEIRGLKLIAADPPPTRTEFSEKDGVTYLYYDLAPDERIPESFMMTATWSFYTFERYTYWEGMNVHPVYDKESDFYRNYTKEEYPIVFKDDICKNSLIEDAQSCVDRNDPDNVMTTALNIYNKIIREYEYDYKHMAWVGYGEAGLVPTSRVWTNQRGVCDEFANLFCAMARINGIPARPCCGWAHIPLDQQMKTMSEEERKALLQVLPNLNKNIGPPMGHAWAEFYVPDYGWIPLDATWGDSEDEVIPADLSPMGNRRGISMVDYYFGKMDPYRITLFKSWNYELLPAPHTPGAEPVEPWMSMPTQRYSGVSDMVHGFDDTYDNPVYAMMSEYTRRETMSTKMFDMKNARRQVIHIDNPPKAEVDEIISEIKAEGYNFISIPQYKWDKDRQETTMYSW